MDRHTLGANRQGYWVRERIETRDLGAADVPGEIRRDDPGSLVRMVAFAHTFNGYAWGGGPAVLGDKVWAIREAWLDGDGLPNDLDRLRACLFLWARADRHRGGFGPDDDDLAWINALLVAIRLLAGQTG